MMNNDPHLGFIVAAYVVAAVVVLSMVAVIASDYRVLRRSLSRFGERGRDRT